MKIKSNTIRALKSYFLEELNNIYEERECISMFEWLMEHYFSKNKSDLILELDKPQFSESDLLKVIFAVKDLKKQKPLAYILGEVFFYDRVLKVNENTLIPRPETEELVDWIIKENKEKEHLHVLDIGTGSGCIIIPLSKHLKGVFYALDVSEKALEVAKQNSALNKTKIHFIKDSILNPEFNLNVKLDLIVSNPPYIPLKDKNLMEKNVLDYEPHLALFVENHSPLLFYDKIADFAKNHLNKSGKLYVEIHEALGKEVFNLLQEKGFKNIEVKKDMNGKDRMIKAVL
jgi:release factor glutamine methyltransferase